MICNNDFSYIQLIDRFRISEYSIVKISNLKFPRPKYLGKGIRNRDHLDQISPRPLTHTAYSRHPKQKFLTVNY